MQLTISMNVLMKYITFQRTLMYNQFDCLTFCKVNWWHFKCMWEI